MSKRHSRQSHKPRSTTGSRVVGPDWPLFGLAVVGLLITGYLTGTAWWLEAPALCGPGSGCDVIQQSRWSRVLGLPLALWGFAVYAAIATLAYLPAPRLRRWKRLWSLALVGVAISLYLTVVGLLALDAVCGWCLASLALISTIFFIVTLRRPESAPGMSWRNWLLNNAGLVVIALVVLHVYYLYDDLQASRQDPRLEALAVHLQESGVRYYGASWCSACREQNQQFGAAYEQLPYVECSPAGRNAPQASECLREGIVSYPTWVIRGRRFEQVLTPEELAEYSRFDWDAAAP